MGNALDNILHGKKKPTGKRTPARKPSGTATPRRKKDELPHGVNAANLPGIEPEELFPAVGLGSTNPLQGRPF